MSSFIRSVHPADLCTIGTSPESTEPGLCFAAGTMGLFSFTSTHLAPEQSDVR